MTDERTIGQIFSEVRAEKGATTSEVASATRMKVQIVEAMEEDDFSGIAAPAYAKGFIKMYAEYLEVDPKPLIQEYLEKHMGAERMPLLAENAPRVGRSGDRGGMANDWTAWLKDIPRERMVQGIAVLLGLLIAATAIVWVSRATRAEEPEQTQPTKSETLDQQRVLEDPPEPYL